jgi:MFS superfamily sulfate permease-like transporter
MPPETAFYVAPPALLLYAIFASSRKLVVVVSATQAALSAGAVAALATAGTSQYEEMTAALALLVGTITVFAGLLRLGVVARFFSPSVLVGFVSGLALVISIKQVPKILGIEAGEGDFWERLWDILVNLDDVHRPTLVVGLATLAVMIAVERIAHRLPAALVALVFGIVVSRAFDLAEHGVEVIEEIPSGLAAPQIPDVTLNDLSLLFAAAVGIALVNFAEGNSMAREFARRDADKLDADQELIGLGAANVGAGLFQGFTIGASLSKSAAAYAAGMQTQMAGIVAAVLTVLVALFLTPLFEGLPEATLGAIVIVAVSGMVKTKRLRELYTLRKTDFRAAQAPVRRLGEQPGGAFVELETHPEAREHPGILVVRPNAGLFFANAEAVAEDVYLAATESEPPARGVVVDLELTSDLDVPAGEALGLLAGRLAEAGIPLALARVQEPTINLLERTGVVEIVGREHIGGRVEDAVRGLES